MCYKGVSTHKNAQPCENSAGRDMNLERIVLASGPNQGHEYVIDGSLSIGRSPENHLQLNDLQISRKHAVILQTPAGTLVRDLGSGNGTFIGDRRVLEYRLSDGDMITIGPFQLKYLNENAPATVPAPVPAAAPEATLTLVSSPELSANVRFEEEGDSAFSAASAANAFPVPPTSFA